MKPEHVAHALCVFNALARNVEILALAFNADELPPERHARHAGRPAAHVAIEHRFSVVRGALQRVNHYVLGLHGRMVKPALFHVANNPAFLSLPNVRLKSMHHVFGVGQVVPVG